MSELRLAIVGCRYPDNVQDQLLKDQYIFGLGVKEIQDHLLGEILPEDTTEKCLLESRKIESQIEQHRLLGIKTSSTYDAVFRGRDKSRNKSCGRNYLSSSSGFVKSCKYCRKSHNRGNCPAFGRKCQKYGRDNHFKLMCKSGNNRESRHPRPKKGKGKGKKFREITDEQKNDTLDNLADQVQSMFYHDIHVNVENTHMHTRLDCEMKQGLKSNEVFKIDTGDDGNLIPMTMFIKLFPNISHETLGKTINRGITLLAYNNTQG